MRDSEEVMPTADEWHEALAQRVTDICSGIIGQASPMVIPKFQEAMDGIAAVKARRFTPMNQHLKTAPSEVKRQRNRMKRKRGK